MDVESNFGNAVYDGNTHILHWYTEGLPQTGNSTVIKARVKFDHGSASDGLHYITTGTHVRAVVTGTDGSDVVKEAWGGNGPALRKQKYTVSWDMNVGAIECGAYPEGENAGRNDPTSHKPKEPDILVQDWQDMVSMPSEIPVCVGWNFKGWRNVETDEDRINEDRFVMPAKSMRFRATWGRPTVSKSTTGQVYEDVKFGDVLMMTETENTYTVYGESYRKFMNNTYNMTRTDIASIRFVSNNDTISIPTKYTYAWDVSEKKNGSVIAYAVSTSYYVKSGTSYDKRSGYDIYIQGKNTPDVKNLGSNYTDTQKYGVHANANSSYLFYKMSNANPIDIHGLDTSNTTNMSHMFDEVKINPSRNKYIYI